MRKEENGFGLIDLAVSLTIMAIIAAGAGMTTMQIIQVTELNEDQATVTQNAHNLERWLYRDILMADNITAGDNPATEDDEFITILRKDWESGDTYDIRYNWLDYVGSLKKLERRQIVSDRDSIIVSDGTSLIAYGIYSANCSQQDNTWIINFETRSGLKSSVQEFKVTKRLN